MWTNILHPRSRNHGSESHHELEGSVLSSNHAGFPKRNASVVHGNPQTVSAEFDCHDAYHRNPCETPVSFNQVSIIARNPASHGPYPLVVDTDTARQTQPCMTPSSLSSNTSVTISSFGSRRSSSQTANTHYSPCSFSAVSSQQTYSPVKRDDCFSDSSPSNQYFPQYAVNPYQQTFSHNCLAGGYQHFQHWASGSTADAYPTPPPATASLAELNGVPVDIPELPGHIAELDPTHVASQLPANLVPVNSEEIAQASFNGMNDAETASYNNNEKVVIDESWWYRPRSHIVYTPKSDTLLEGEGSQLCGIPSLDNSGEVDQNYGENTTLSPPSRPPSKKRKGKPAGKNSNTPPRSQDCSECSECNQQFTGDYQVANLRRHIRSFHSTGEENKCSYCDRTYKRSDAKRKHEWKKHRAEDARPQKRRSEKRDLLTYF